MSAGLLDQIDAPSETAPLGPSRWRTRHPLAFYVIKRLLLTVVLVFVVSVLVFIATAVLPGDLASAILGRNASPETLAALRSQLGADQPLVVQYLQWISGFVHGDLGTSALSATPVSELLGTRIFNTVWLAAVTVVVMVPIGLLLGVISAVRADSAVDRTISSVALLGISLPDFVVASLLTLFLAVRWGLVPSTSLLPPGEVAVGHPELLVLPTLTLLLVGSAYIIRMSRAGVLEVIGLEYVEMARLNGVVERRVLWRYVLRNSLATTVQVVTLTLQWLIGGVFIVETVFAYPGLGLGLVQAVNARDIPYIQAASMFIAITYVLLNLMADLLVVAIVPKLRAGLR